MHLKQVSLNILAKTTVQKSLSFIVSRRDATHRSHCFIVNVEKISDENKQKKSIFFFKISIFCYSIVNPAKCHSFHESQLTKANFRWHFEVSID